jgi:hypothetical protein
VGEGGTPRPRLGEAAEKGKKKRIMMIDYKIKKTST